MASEDTLPIILVSAIDRSTANKIIADVTEGSESRQASPAAGVDEGRVWSINNKYYSADVVMLPRGDGEPLACDPARIEAHLIFLTADECSDESAWARRAGSAAAAAVRAEVLVAAAAAPLPRAARPDLRDYEPVCLAAAAEDEGEGLARVREALHAHTWRGLTRHRRGHAAPAAAPLPARDEEDDADGWSQEGVEQWARVADAVAAAARLSPRARRARAAALLPDLLAVLRLPPAPDDDDPTLHYD